MIPFGIHFNESSEGVFILVQDVILPDSWPESVRVAMLHVISLAHAAITYSRSWCADSPLARVRLKGQLEQARDEISLLREEIRIML